MSSNVRIAYPGAFYHIINRGVQQQAIYYREQDKAHFERLLGEMTIRYRVQVHAYCLMDNHFHLTVCTPEANISEAIHYLESAYVNRMNSELEREGPFFQGRFKAILVEKDEYLTHLTRYIHLNPVKARMVNLAQAYRWSSYAAYIGLVEPPSWLDMSVVLELFDHNMGSYQQFVEEHQAIVLDHFFAKKNIPVMLGTEKFRQKLEQIVKTYPSKKRAPLLELLKARYSPAQIEAEVIKVFDVDKNELYSKDRKNRPNIPRLVFIHICKEKSGMRNAELRNLAGVETESGVCTVVRRLKTFAAKDQSIQDKIDLCFSLVLAQEPCNTHNLLDPE